MKDCCYPCHFHCIIIVVIIFVGVVVNVVVVGAIVVILGNAGMENTATFRQNQEKLLLQVTIDLTKFSATKLTQKCIKILQCIRNCVQELL